VYSN